MAFSLIGDWNYDLENLKWISMKKQKKNKKNPIIELLILIIEKLCHLDVDGTPLIGCLRWGDATADETRR